MKLDLPRYVPGLLSWLSNKVSASASQLYRERFDLGVTDWRMLSYFEIYPWSTASSAADLQGIDKGAVSRSVAMLLERGWLKSRPSGLRKIEYAATAQGNKLHDRIYRLAREREEALLTGFSAAERERLIQYMTRMLANLDAVQAVGWDEPRQG